MTERVKIKCDDCKFVDDCVDYGWQGCKKFTPAPSTPMNNEEYMRSCNTEQLVDAIFECTMANSWNFSKNGIKRWLKQPHTPNSIFVRSGKW